MSFKSAPPLILPLFAESVSQAWNWVRLDEISVVVDCPHSTPILVDDVDAPLVARSQDIRTGTLLVKQSAKVSEETYLDRVKRAEPKFGDLLYSREGTYFGIAAEVPSNTRVCLGQRMVLIQPCHEIVNHRFLKYWLNSPQVFGHIHGFRDGTVAERLNLPTIRGLAVSLPPLPEQRWIGELLYSLDNRITLLRETNATLEAIAQALFKSWFVDFDPVRAKAEGLEPQSMDAPTAALFPDSFEESELGLVPKGWRVGTVADLATFQNGYAFKSKDWVESGHPVVKIGDVKPGIIDLAGCSFVAPESTIGLERFRLNRGDLLVGMTGYVGETGLVPTVQPSAYLNQRVGRFSTSSGLADLGFVYCLVRNPAFKIFAEAQSHGSAQANVSGAALIAYPSVIPSKGVLDQFNGVLASVLEAVLSNHEQAQTLTQLRDTLLPRLISGQLRLPEAQAWVA